MTPSNPITIEDRRNRAIRRFLVASWAPILFEYDGLTSTEQECCPSTQFYGLVLWIMARPEDYSDLSYEGLPPGSMPDGTILTVGQMHDEYVRRGVH